jgi:hypothetical protein
MKRKSYLIIGLFFATIMVSACGNYKKIKDIKCNILNADSLPQIKILLERARIDTSSYRMYFYIDYSRKGYYLIDKKNKWELNFSDKYFDVQVKYYDSSFVVLYCVISGIMNGLTLFPITNNNLYVINRKLGKKVLNIESEEGISSAIIKDNILYFACYEPKVVRYFKW